MLSERGSAFRRSIKSRPDLIGLSARTITARCSLNSKAIGVTSTACDVVDWPVMRRIIRVGEVTAR